MSERSTRTVGIEALRNVMEAFLVRGGCSLEVAKEVANVFLEADLRGVPTQGLHHLVNVMMPHLLNGKIDPNGKPEVVREGPGYALVDGHFGPGQIAATFAVEVGIPKAYKNGTVGVGIVNSSDLFMLGYYVERFARSGLVGLGFTDSPPLVHAFGGIERVLGTNPLAISVPTAGDSPVLVDIATSMLSASHVRHAMYHNEPLPNGAGIGPDGAPTRDARLAWSEGALSPFGGHKGFCLGLCVALLSGPLVGGAVGRGVDGWMPNATGRPGSKGHFFIGINPENYGDPEGFRSAVTKYIGEVKASRKIPGKEIRIPGEYEFSMRAERLRLGKLPVFEAIWEQARELANKLGVTMAE